MNPLQKLNLGDFQNLMSVIEQEHSMQKFGSIINRAGSTANRMVSILIDLGYIARNMYMIKKNRTFRILRDDLIYDELKEYIGSSTVERQRIVGDKVNDTFELQVLPHKTIILNFSGKVSTVNYGF